MVAPGWPGSRASRRRRRGQSCGSARQLPRAVRLIAAARLTAAWRPPTPTRRPRGARCAALAGAFRPARRTRAGERLRRLRPLTRMVPRTRVSPRRSLRAARTRTDPRGPCQSEACAQATSSSTAGMHHTSSCARLSPQRGRRKCRPSARPRMLAATGLLRRWRHAQRWRLLVSRRRSHHHEAALARPRGCRCRRTRLLGAVSRWRRANLAGLGCSGGRGVWPSCFPSSFFLAGPHRSPVQPRLE